jgi:hypothetical protein
MHWNAAKRVLQYLKGTRTWRSAYGEDSAGRGLEEYADADGLSLENRKAISGYAFLINQSALALAHAELGQFHARTKHIDIQYHFISTHSVRG